MHQDVLFPLRRLDEVFALLEAFGIQRTGYIFPVGQPAKAAVVAADAGADILHAALPHLGGPVVVRQEGPGHGYGIHRAADHRLQGHVRVAHLAGDHHRDLAEVADVGRLRQVAGIGHIRGGGWHQCQES